MPAYEYDCPKCKRVHTELLSFDEYEALDGPVQCEWCGADIYVESRIIGKGLYTTVIGVSKGNYNGRDTT